MPQLQEFSTTRTDIAGLDVYDLASQFGTPTFVYDASVIQQRVADLNQFDVVRYAQKACSNIAIVDLVRQAGGVVDAVSAGEIHRALLAGFKGGPGENGTPEIVYTADIFDQTALDLIAEHNIHVNCGSPDMISQLAERVQGAHITLRLNPGFGHGHSQKTNTGGEQSKHGIWFEQLSECKSIADSTGLTISGLHMHIGSGTDLEHLAQVCGSMKQAALEVGPSISVISAGGGLPVPYNSSQSYMDLDRYYALWDEVRKSLETEFEHSLSLEIEPGRYLSAESGYLVTEIRAIKEMGNNRFYLVDAGFNNLARPIMYGSYHPISIVPRGGESRDEHPVIVGGPLCESGDIFTQEEGGFVASRQLPVAEVGELLVIECAGAYGSVMGSNYNSKPLASEVLIKEGQAHLIRARQSLDDITRGESIPS